MRWTLEDRQSLKVTDDTVPGQVQSVLMGGQAEAKGKVG